VYLHSGKKKVLVFSQVIGENFLSSVFHALLRHDCSLCGKQYPQPVPGSQPGLERCFGTTLHSTLVLQEFVTWEAAVTKQRGAGSNLLGWGLASPPGPRQVCVEAALPSVGCYLLLGSFVYS